MKSHLAAAVLAGCLGASGALAQSAPAPATKAEADALFQQVYRNPGNLDLLFRYAQVATEAGDYEAAIGAYERMLFFNQNLPRVRLELGALYYRIGATVMARKYFDEVLATPDAPQPVRERVLVFVDRIERGGQPDEKPWSIFAQLGLRYQTNGNAGPNSSFVRALGFDATLSDKFVKKPDWNAFAQTELRHSFRLSETLSWDSQVLLYYARQFRFEQFNLGLAEFRTGPRLRLFGGEGGALSLRPYLVAGGVSLADRPYLGSAGGGVSLLYERGDRFWIEPSFEARRRAFHNSSWFPTARLQTGNLYLGAVQAGGAFNKTFGWRAGLGVSSNLTSENARWQTYRQTALYAALPITLDYSLGGAAKSLKIIPGLSYAEADYGRPDPVVDPNVKRRDRITTVALGVDAPLSAWAGISGQIAWSQTLSNLPNYSTRNVSVMVGPYARF